MRTLLIDDLREFVPGVLSPGTELTVARTSAEALNILNNTDEVWDQIWFDHDLGDATGEIDSIMPVIDHLGYLAHVEGVIVAHQAFIHSSNPVGVKAMTLSLKNYGYSVIRVDAAKHFIVQ